jgi:hypothetical protein
MTLRSMFVMAIVMAAFASRAEATGLATCNSGPQSGWQSEDVLRKKLVDQGWQIRRIKIDGGCYEVYALDGSGKRVEAYFHPVTLDSVPTRPR